VSLLDAHPQVDCANELFNSKSVYVLPRLPLNGSFYHANWTAQAIALEQYYRGELTRSGTPRRWSDGAHACRAHLAGAEAVHCCGFKELYGFVPRDERPAMVAWLRAHRVKVIHLWRPDRIAQYLSLAQAKASNVWHMRGNPTGAPHTAAPPLHIIWEDMNMYMFNQTRAYHYFRDALGCGPADTCPDYIEVTYEELHDVGRREQALARLWAFLGVTVPAVVPTSILHKLNPPRPCADRVANWDAIHPEIARTYPDLLRWCD
jgi:hypothetical protein